MNIKGRWTIGALIGIAIAALALRLSSLPTVFYQGSIRFLEPDAYYHMRRIIHAAENFPDIILSDSYINYPYGFEIGWPPLFDQMIAAFSWALGLGNPDIHLIEMVGAVSPVVIGVLMIIPAFFIGKLLFERTEYGVAAALFTAILPAHVLVSLFGFVDHHVFETFLLSLMVLVYLLMVRRLEWLYHLGVIQAFVILIALYSFPSAPIYCGIIGLALFAGIIIRQWKGEASRDLLVFGLLSFGIAALISALINRFVFCATNLQAGSLSLFQPAYLAAWFCILAIAGLLALYFSGRPFTVYLGSLAGIGIAGFLTLFLATRSLWDAIISGLTYVTRGDPILGTIVEAHSIFFPEGSFTLAPIWDLFSVPLLLAIAGFGIYISYQWQKREIDDGAILFSVLFLVSFVLVAFQMRFLYVFALPIAVAGGYGLVRVLMYVGFGEQLTASHHKEKAAIASGKRKKPENSQKPVKKHVSLALSLVALIIFAPTVYSAAHIQTAIAGTPTDDWMMATAFLKEETPVTSYYDDPVLTPEYGVMSLWYWGNLIIYSGERPVVSNNFQTGMVDSATFFTTGSVAVAQEILDRRGCRYVVTESFRPGSFANLLLISGVSQDIIQSEAFWEILESSVYYQIHYFDAEDLPEYSLVYRSPSILGGTNAVKIFEYQPA
ncbi:MAG: STT3 domain-containing protein [Methanocalculus sp.]|uniref:STT3 domain-containing protein n=1 Tax=Methanocalculus sp. TaxID=2004547 RepID=UPI002725139E|nr:STT3 domain-containing protein [Methanocalculus sp.]MDO9538549.1 STT3 domain-containing protein [Methanocalculus sp.]